MKSYGVGAERIDLIPKQILDFFDYVEGTWVVPEKDIFTIEGINRRGWFYLGSCLTTGEIFHINRISSERKPFIDEEGKSTLSKLMKKKIPLDQIARRFLTSPSYN